MNAADSVAREALMNAVVALERNGGRYLDYTSEPWYKVNQISSRADPAGPAAFGEILAC